MEETRGAKSTEEADKLNRKLDFPSGLRDDASMAKLSAGCYHSFNIYSVARSGCVGASGLI